MTKKWITALTLVVLFAAVAAAQEPALSKELAALQGTWNIVSVNGQQAADQGISLTVKFTGNKYEQSLNGDVVETGTVKLDASQKPMTLEFNILEGSDAGKVQLGIVEIAGDTATFALAQPGDPTRPSDFTSTTSGGVFVTKKVK